MVGPSVRLAKEKATSLTNIHTIQVNLLVKTSTSGICEACQNIHITKINSVSCPPQLHLQLMSH